MSYKFWNIFEKSSFEAQNPFFGTTDFDIQQLDNSKYLNLIVGSYEGLIYNYQIN